MPTRVDALVIGSGPGGYPCAIRLGQLGVKTVIVEKAETGGVCLNVGCIPSKALIHAAKSFEKASGKLAPMGIEIPGKPTVDMGKMQVWKSGIVKKLTGGVAQLLKANGATLVKGFATLTGATSDGYKVVVDNAGSKTEYIAKSVVLATGSRPIVIPGFELDDTFIIDSTGALDLDQIPGRMTVIGGGYIGLELGMVYAKLGSKVTVVEAMDSLLATMDQDCVKVVGRTLKKMGVEVVTGAMAKRWENKGDRAVVTVEKNGKPLTIDADKVLVSVGRRPNSESIGLDSVGVKLTERGYVKVDEQLRTNVPGIYCIGDLNGGMMLAHKATKEGEVCAEVIAGHKAAFDVRTIPAVVFTDPEISSTGMTEDEAKKAGIETKVGKFPFAALGRALSVNDTAGFAKIIADAKTDEIIGAHIVGNGAADLISEIALAIEMGAVLQDLALTIHPHPTLSEALMEASAAALGEAIHIVNR